MNEKRDAWQARIARAAIEGIPIAAILYLLIGDFKPYLPTHADAIGVGDVVVHFARLFFIVIGAICLVQRMFDWLRKFRSLMRRQREPMN